MFAILCTDGQMNLEEVRNECQPGQWVPLFTYTEGDDPTPIIPLFHDQKTAKSFIKRNLPKDWLHGGVQLTDEDIAWIKNKGWRIREMTYPNRLTDLKHITFGMEILEFSTKPDMHYGRL